MKETDSKHRLQELIDFLGITPTEFCNRCGLGKSALSNYLNGDRVPRQDKIALIADAFKVDPAWLMGYKTPMMRQTASMDNDIAVELMMIYRELNQEGQFEMLNHAHYLLSQPKYKKRDGFENVQNK